jgi:hypothetical protein
VGTEFRLEFIPGKRRPGVDECDQGWARCTREPGLDYTNLQRMIREADALDAAWDYAYTHRVVEVDVTYVDQWDVAARRFRKVEVDLSPARLVA